jgi:hypothetical protein
VDPIVLLLIKNIREIEHPPLFFTAVFPICMSFMSFKFINYTIHCINYINCIY